MAGNVLGKGYTAGVGMTIGTAFGRIAGVQAAKAAKASKAARAAKADQADKTTLSTILTEDTHAAA
jgi:tricarballylate dehydrogenase